MEDRVRLALRSEWTIPSLWALLSLGAMLWAIQAVGSDVVALFRPAIDPTGLTPFTLSRFYGRLIGYWTVAIPLGIAVSVVLHRRRSLKPTLPRSSIWYAPIIVAALLFVPIAKLAFEGVHHPLHGPAGWFPWVSLTTLVIGWVTRVRLLSIGSVPLLLFSAYWYRSGSAALGLLPLTFVVGYAAIALGLRIQASKR